MRLMISGGGTGGHIYPALALVHRLKEVEPSSEVLFVGSYRGLESQIVPKEDVEFKQLEIQGFKRSLSLSNFKTVCLFLKSVREARKMIKEFKPDAVVGTGGYVSGAVVYAAARLHVPTLIQEQNSVVGITNRFLSRYVDRISTSFDAAKEQFPADKVIKTGNPRAQEAANVTDTFDWTTVGLQNDKKTVLVVGGSQGALKINKVMSALIPQLADKDYQMAFVTGESRYDSVREAISHVPNNVVVLPYIQHMPVVLSSVDLVVGRAGATSIAEILAMGVASVLIPSPYVTANHQTKNAQALVKRGAAEMITEEDLSVDQLLPMIDQLMQNDEQRQTMTAAAKAIGTPSAADDILNELNELIAAKK